MKPSVVLALVVFSASAQPDRDLNRGVARPGFGSGRRVALVIGNDAYVDANALHNAVNDARAMKAALEEVGFTVQTRLNTTKQQMETAIEEFTGTIRPGDVALFFYSGHGLAVQDQNYLIPVDFHARTAVDAKYAAYPAQQVLDNLEAAGAAMQILILDACRNNPFRSLRGGPQGLAAMQAGRGTYIAFATAPGATADDNPTGKNGLFTGELIGVLGQAGLSIDQVFNRVREQVATISHGVQLPWSTSSVIGDFYFNLPQGSIASAPPRERAPSQPSDLTVELAYWDSIKDENDPALLEEYLRRYPNGQFTTVARSKLTRVKPTNTPSAPPSTANLPQTLSGRPARPPTRDPNTPGYVTGKELPDGSNAPPDSDGNFILGPTHNPAPEMTVQEKVQQGEVFTFTMESVDSKFYPGVAREPNTFATVDPNDPTKLIVKSHPAPYTRRVTVYVPRQYVPGTLAPFIVGADGPDNALFTALDNLIAERKVPVMIAISIGNGGGDAEGSERGLEYDTMSPRYGEFVENEVLPLVEKQYNVKLTKDPEGRATMGGSSGGSCALIMAWYHPGLYHRVLTYSGSFVNQQWPPNPDTPDGAWEFHERLIPNAAPKPLRIWMEVGDRDNLITRDNMHDWVLANENMARVLAAKGYHYQFVFARNGGHSDRAVKQQVLPEALEYVWKGYPIEGPKK